MNTSIIYIGNYSISFSVERELFTKKLQNNAMIYKPNAKEDLKEVFIFFINQNKFSDLIFVCSNPKKMFERFIHSFKIIEAAGGLIQQSNSKKTLMIYRWNKWDLPKGKIEKNESVRSAAIRECEEECAVGGLKIKSTIAPTYHMYLLKDNWVVKKTHWFLMSTGFSQKLLPQTEEGITKVEWMNKAQMKKALDNTYPNIIQVIKSLL